MTEAASAPEATAAVACGVYLQAVHPADGGRYGPPGTPHPHSGHRLVELRLGAVLRVQPRQPSAPFDIGNERRAEFRIVRQPGFIGGLEQQCDPLLALRLGQTAVEVVLDHRGMATEFFAVGFRPAEHLAEEGGDMHRMVAGHVAEHRLQQRVLQHRVVKHAGQAVQRVDAAGPFVKRWYFCAHAGFLIGRST